MSKTPLVGVIMGSISDKAVMSKCVDYLNHFEISHTVDVLSAHRNAQEVDKYASTAEERGLKVIIAGAGMAAALPGVIAARTIIPVIGVPLEVSALHGQDALFSMVQMPPGIPVATVAIGSAGAKNAAILATEIIALSDKDINYKLKEFRKKGSKI